MSKPEYARTPLSQVADAPTALSLVARLSPRNGRKKQRAAQVRSAGAILRAALSVNTAAVGFHVVEPSSMRRSDSGMISSARQVQRDGSGVVGGRRRSAVERCIPEFTPLLYV